MTSQEVSDKVSQEREIERNKQDAITLAAKLFKIVNEPEIKDLTPMERHQLFIDKNKSFSQAFPLVLAKMTRELRYNEVAFRRFLEGLHKNPGKGTEGYIEHQAHYAKYLYQEECRANNVHINTQHAKEIFNGAYKDMSVWIKDIKKREKIAKNEYRDESQKNLESRRAEFLDFMNQVRPAPAEDSIQIDDAEYKASKNETVVPEEPTVSQQPAVVSDTVKAKVSEALEKREAAKPSANNNDWLQDSLVPKWNASKNRNNRKK
jgi:hypothetical protein